MDKQKNIRAIRDHFESWGCDASSMTDEELESSLLEAAKAVASVGFTMEEASDAVAFALGRQ